MKNLSVVGIFVCVLFSFLIVPKRAKAEDLIDKELDYFWGKKRKIEVIQKRLFLREGRHEFTFFTGAIPNDDFFVYYPIGLKYDYYISEDFAIELSGSWLFKTKSDLENFLETNEIIDVSVYLPEYLKYYGFISGVYSPFHGKLAVFTTKLAHFDINIAFGLGIMGFHTVENREAKNEFSPAGNLGLGFRFYLNNWMALRIDYRHYFYKSTAYNGLSWPAEFTVGLSLFTKAPK